MPAWRSLWFWLGLGGVAVATLSPGPLRNRLVGALAGLLRKHFAVAANLEPGQVADGLHGLLYGGLGFALGLGVTLRWPLALGAVVFAGATECAQWWVPGRTASVIDALINMGSLLLGLGFGMMVKRWSPAGAGG